MPIKRSRQRSFQRGDRLTHRIIEALSEFGPSTRADLENILYLDKPGSIGTALRQLLSQHTRHGQRKRKQIYVKAWTESSPPRRIYARGALPCAPRPKAMTSAERSTNFRRRKAATLTIPNSVFNLCPTPTTP